MSNWLNDRGGPQHNVAQPMSANAKWAPAAPATTAVSTTISALNTGYLASFREPRRVEPSPMARESKRKFDQVAIYENLCCLQNQIRDALLRSDLSEQQRAGLVQRAIDVSRLIKRVMPEGPRTA